ncbi:hypothetical protein TorRG33x02_059470, partial [Trema orientale]
LLEKKKKKTGGTLKTDKPKPKPNTHLSLSYSLRNQTREKEESIPINDEVDLLRIGFRVEQVAIAVVVIEKARALGAEVGGAIEVPEIDIVGEDIVHGEEG